MLYMAASGGVATTPPLLPGQRQELPSHCFHFFRGQYTRCIHLLMHANATLDRTSALVNVSLTQRFVATNALPHLQIDSTAEMLDRRRLG